MDNTDILRINEYLDMLEDEIDTLDSEWNVWMYEGCENMSDYEIACERYHRTGVWYEDPLGRQHQVPCDYKPLTRIYKF